MKKTIVFLKSHFNWIILGITFFFLFHAFKIHWQGVKSVNITARSGILILGGVVVSAIAHFCSAWTWVQLLHLLQQPLSFAQGIRVYLRTNLAKYIPGNIWHFSGRIQALMAVGSSLGMASLSVMLEPILLLVGGLAIALSGSLFLSSIYPYSVWLKGLSLIGIICVFSLLHPLILNPVVRFLSKKKGQSEPSTSVAIKEYPFVPLLGSLGFQILRGMGFVLVLNAFMPIHLAQLPFILSIFSVAWFLGMVIPGAPGGIGVFETTALTLLSANGMNLDEGLCLTSLAVFRLVSLAAEAMGAGLTFTLKNH